MHKRPGLIKRGPSFSQISRVFCTYILFFFFLIAVYPVLSVVKRLEPVPAIMGRRQGTTWKNHQFTTGLTTASFTQILAGKSVQIMPRMTAFTRDHQTVCAQHVGKSPGEPRRAAHKQQPYMVE